MGLSGSPLCVWLVFSTMRDGIQSGHTVWSYEIDVYAITEVT